MPDRTYGLGRHPHHDPRNDQYPLRAQLPEHVARVTKVWDKGAVLDQGQLGACTGFGWTDFLAALPAPQLDSGKDTDKFAIDYYSLNTKNDPYPGSYPTDDTGSSTLAGAKTGTQLGLVQSYHWAKTVDDIVDAIITLGPVVVGTDWLDGMFNPDAEGLIRCTGKVAGGHCYLLRGVILGKQFASGTKDVFVLQNSWGPGWGDGGDAYVEIGDYTKLWANQGDGCLAVKVNQPAPTPVPPTPTPPSPDPGAAPFPGASVAVAHRIAQAAGHARLTVPEWLEKHFEHYFGTG